MKRPLFVVKLGGSIFARAKDLVTASAEIARVSEKAELVIVVSALRGDTDRLLKMLKRVSGRVDPSVSDDVIAMGERTSARLFCAALAARGLKVQLVDVDTPYWPIVTDERHQDAQPIFSGTAEACRSHLEPLIGAGFIPVVCGFIGRSRTGKITTLGRGGSDTTATLLGKCLGADEVILVKDVEGVFSSPPLRVRGAKRMEKLSVEELRQIAKSGSKIVQEKALRYVDGYSLRITSFSQGLSGGTVIDQFGRTDGFECRVTFRQVCVVTLVSPSKLMNYSVLLEKAKETGATPIALSTNSSSALLYVDGEVTEQQFHFLVEEEMVKAVSVMSGLSCISVGGPGFEETPGAIAAIVYPLTQKKVNVYGFTTIGDSSKVFVSSGEADVASTLIGNSVSQMLLKKVEAAAHG